MGDVKIIRGELSEQYKNAANLNARIRLHQRFSANPYGWFRWVFDQFTLPPVCRILELGCGPGDLWFENRDRIPEGWEVILTDFSPGMLKQAQERLQELHPFQFGLLKAQAVPYEYENHSLDAVVANHMLFHVPDREAVFSEINRVLKPGRCLFASTGGRNHLKEIAELRGRFDPGLRSWGNLAEPFLFENGEAQLRKWFAKVKLCRYEDSLNVTEAAPLAEYILSSWAEAARGKEKELREFIARELEKQGGTIHITVESGVFIARTKEEEANHGIP